MKSKIKEILKKYNLTPKSSYLDNQEASDIIDMMKEYAIYCCQLQKEICAKIAIDMASFDFEINEHGQDDLEYEIKRSPLPEELR